jgi:hypothetical protein
MQDLSINKRILTVYTKDIKLPIYQEQLRSLDADKKGLLERDIVIKKVVYGNSTARIFKKNKISADFSIVLTGKDGGEKFRSTKLTTPKQLYNIIDAMPMRKSEMKSKR